MIEYSIESCATGITPNAPDGSCGCFRPSMCPVSCMIDSQASFPWIGLSYQCVELLNQPSPPCGAVAGKYPYAVPGESDSAYRSVADCVDDSVICVNVRFETEEYIPSADVTAACWMGVNALKLLVGSDPYEVPIAPV